MSNAFCRRAAWALLLLTLLAGCGGGGGRAGAPQLGGSSSSGSSGSPGATGSSGRGSASGSLAPDPADKWKAMSEYAAETASEAIINGPRGVNVDVVLIGGKTCGKPYGFTAKDNCGISHFPIEFAGVNAKGFGDYADGFVPGSGPTVRYAPGCTVADDLGHALGDPQEGMLATALHLQRHPARSSRLLLPR